MKITQRTFLFLLVPLGFLLLAPSVVAQKTPPITPVVGATFVGRWLPFAGISTSILSGRYNSQPGGRGSFRYHVTSFQLSEGLLLDHEGSFVSGCGFFYLTHKIPFLTFGANTAMIFSRSGSAASFYPEIGIMFPSQVSHLSYAFWRQRRYRLSYGYNLFPGPTYPGMLRHTLTLQLFWIGHANYVDILK